MEHKLILSITMIPLFLMMIPRTRSACLPLNYPASKLDIQDCGRYCGKKLAVFPNSITNYVKNRKGHLADMIRKRMTSRPIAVWMGDWSSDVESKAREIKSFALRRNSMYLIVVYNIPQRDCNHYSGGGVDGADGYRRWINKLSRGLKGGNGIVVVEPDALALVDCLKRKDIGIRFSLIKYAVRTLRRAGAKVYIDAGHANWLKAHEAARRLERAGVYYANGFALNTANAVSTKRSIQYGNNIVKQLKKRKGFVIDVSRNGAGVAKGSGEDLWCNSPSYRLGQDPTLSTRKFGQNVEALLWIKVPGESDGTCNGGPPAGTFSPNFAKRLLS